MKPSGNLLMEAIARSSNRSVLFVLRPLLVSFLTSGLVLGMILPASTLLGSESSDSPTREVPESVPTDHSEGESSHQFFPLHHTELSEAGQHLRRLLGSRLAVSESSGGAWVFSRGRQRVELSLDRSRNGMAFTGSQKLMVQFSQLVRALEQLHQPTSAGRLRVRILPVQQAEMATVQEAVDAYHWGMDPSGAASERSENAVETGPSASQQSRRLRLPVVLAQHTEAVAAQEPSLFEQDFEPLPPEGLGVFPADEDVAERIGRLMADRVEIEILPDLDVIILRGRDPDVEEVARIIEEIERLAALTVPEIEIYRLNHVHNMSIVTILNLVAQDLIGGRQGRIHVTPLVKPNALLLIGWGEAIRSMKELIDKLDQPVSPDSQLRVYQLQHAGVLNAAGLLQESFGTPEGLGPRVELVPDERTNSLIVRAAPRDLAEVDLLISRLDRPESGFVNQARLFQLRNTLATELAITLSNAFTAAGGPPGEPRSAILELLTADAEGERMIRSGVLSDVQVTPDPHTNTLVVTAPVESMDLLAALIKQLDVPSGVAQIKVFNIVNGDATRMVEMLRALMPAEAMIAGPALAGAEDEGTMVPVRFSVDIRTNNIIATGSEGDLEIIEALLLLLDEEDVEERINEVYNLKNAPATDVADAVNEFLRSERALQMALPGIVGPYAMIEAEVVVVPEPVSNTLIISATPRYYERIMNVIEKLDAQPAQVMIQVVIAEVRLSNSDEFGVELGLKDSVLFDREQAGGASLGNRVGSGGFTDLNVGRANPTLGYGGLVLSASSDSVDVLIRALQRTSKLEVLGRPQIMTLDNEAAFIQVGARVPRIVGARLVDRVQTNIVELENVGLILGVTPRISPEGMVVMEIDAERSRLGPESEGIPISIDERGEAVRSPQIEVTTAQTTVSAASGETIVLGGLITKSTSQVRRGIPYLSSLPVVGALFRYEIEEDERTELLIFMTPQVIRDREDAERVKQLEAARMSWCLADVHELHGPTGIHEQVDFSAWGHAGQVIYPARTPEGIPEEAYVPEAELPEATGAPPGEVLPLPGPYEPGSPFADDEFRFGG